MKKSTAVITLLTSLVLQSSTFAADSEMAMNQNMQEMQKVMEEIKTEQDPEKREALMMQHMEVMHKGMEMMGQQTGAPASGMAMGDRMEGMEKRMEMMQMMMGQMMEQEAAEMENPTHEHAP